MESRAQDGKKMNDKDGAHIALNLLRSMPPDLLRHFIANYFKLPELLSLRTSCRFFRDHSGIQDGVCKKLNGLHTLLIPSPSLIAERKAQGNDNAEVDVDIYMTRDHLKVGCQLMIAFEFTNLDIALRRFKLGELRDFIKNIVSINVSKIISSVDSMQLLHAEHPQLLFISIKEAMNKGLGEYGIRLCRLTIEKINVLNPEPANKMRCF